MQGTLKRSPVVLVLFSCQVYAAGLFECGYVSVFLSGMVLRSIDAKTEWRLFLLLDIVSKVLNPCIIVALLEQTAADATMQGVQARWQVCNLFQWLHVDAQCRCAMSAR